MTETTGLLDKTLLLSNIWRKLTLFFFT
jgi:hypothetical protein